MNNPTSDCNETRVGSRFWPPGFTLIELVVSIVIIGVIALVTTQYLVSAAQVYALLLAQRQADSELMGAVDRMRGEARTAKSVSAAAANEWTFVNDQGGRTNRLAGSAVTVNGNILARGVDRFAFKYFDKTNSITTNLTAIDHVELSIKVTNGLADSEQIVNFFVMGGFLK